MHWLSSCHNASRYHKRSRESDKRPYFQVSSYHEGLAGDKLVCSGSIYPVTIVSLDIDLCKITVRNDAGDAFIIYCEEVDQWPWELEQKGGSHEADA